MKVLFHGKMPLVRTRGFVMLCILQLSLLALPAYSQEQPQGASDSHRLRYGLHLGFTENNVDIYSTQGGTVASDVDHTFYAPGFRMAVIGELPLGRCFSLRAMPGVALFSSYKLESVRGELPVDVKFHPYRWGRVEPYLTSGLGYGFDFASQREDGHTYIKPLNAHDLRYNCALGVDWQTPYVRVGLELKAGFNLLSPGTGGNNFSYFYSGPTFGLGLNFEA